MTLQELEHFAQKYLDGCEPKIRSLQRKVNAAFLSEYGDQPGLATITEQKERWAISALGNFSAGYVRGMDHKPSAAEALLIAAMF